MSDPVREVFGEAWPAPISTYGFPFEAVSEPPSAEGPIREEDDPFSEKPNERAGRLHGAARDPGAAPCEEVPTMPNGVTIYRQQTVGGTYLYLTDEIGGGAVVFDTVVNLDTIETALYMERMRRMQERVEKEPARQEPVKETAI